MSLQEEHMLSIYKYIQTEITFFILCLWESKKTVEKSDISCCFRKNFSINF
jgi:hypothetical protein